MKLKRICSLAALILTSMITGSMVSFFLLPVKAQTSLVERVGVVEAREHTVENDTARLTTDIMILRSEIEMDRDKLSEQQSRISTVQGIGIGLGSIVMILQIFSMLQGFSHKVVESDDVK